MLVTKQQLKAHAFASTDAERPAINHVRLDPDGRTMATNGHVAVIVEPLGQAKIEETEFPEIPGLQGDQPRVPLYLPVDTAKAGARIAGSLARLLVNGHVVIGGQAEPSQLVIVEPPAVEEFPAVEASVPVGQPDGYVCVNADYLELVAKYARAFGKGTLVKLSVFGPGAPLRAEFTDEHHRVTALIMPLRDERSPAPSAGSPKA